MAISVITPAHNEEHFITKCLESVRTAAAEIDEPVEHIVVLNRCDDHTEEIAQQYDCRIVHEDARCLARIRNAGVAAARHEIVVTIDADSWMTPNMLREVERKLANPKIIGGGVRMIPERLSVGIIFSLLVVMPFVLWHRITAGMFWCRKKDFDALDGFDESLACVEDVDFAKRLKALGKSRGQKFATIRRAHLTTSCRKFDQFGDWCFVRHPGWVVGIFRADRKIADEFYYDARR